MWIHRLLPIAVCLLDIMNISGLQNRRVFPKQDFISVPNVCDAGVIRIVSARLFRNDPSGNLDTSTACNVTDRVIDECEWEKSCSIYHTNLVSIYNCEVDQFLEITYDCFVFREQQRNTISKVRFIRLSETCGENVIRIRSAKILKYNSSGHPSSECDVTDYVIEMCEWRNWCYLYYESMVNFARCVVDDYFELIYTCFDATNVPKITDARIESADVVLISPGFPENTRSSPSKCTIRPRDGQFMFIRQMLEFKYPPFIEPLSVIGLNNRQIYLSPFKDDFVVNYTSLLNIELTEVLIAFDIVDYNFWVVIEIEASSILKVHCQTRDLFPDYPDYRCETSSIATVTPVTNIFNSSTNDMKPHTKTGEIYIFYGNRIDWPDAAIAVSVLSTFSNAILFGLFLAFYISQKSKYKKSGASRCVRNVTVQKEEIPTKSWISTAPYRKT